MEILFNGKAIRDRYGVDRISKKCNFSRSSVFRWKEKQRFRLETIVKLEAGLGIDIADYLNLVRYPRSFGGRFKLLRHLAGCSLIEVAEELRTSVYAVYQIEHNNYYPTESEIENIATFFGIEKQYLENGGKLHEFI